MPNDSATLKLLGDRVPLAEFVSAMAHFRGLIDALAADVASGTEIEWLIDGLEVGSATATIRGVVAAEADEPAVERVVDAYIDVGRRLASDSAWEAGVSNAVAAEASGLTVLLNGNIEAIQFESAEAEAIVRLRAPTVATEPLLGLFSPGAGSGAYGAVQGRIQTVTSRHGLRFTLFDSLTDRAVSCYLATDSDELVRNVWGRRAIVEGWVTRDPMSGRPVAVRRVTAITTLSDDEPGSYRDARGLLPLARGGLLPEDAIRRVRDA